MTEVLDRIRGALVGLKMPRALEALDHAMQRLEQGEISGIEAIDALLSEEFATRETRRIEIALSTATAYFDETVNHLIANAMKSDGDDETLEQRQLPK